MDIHEKVLLATVDKDFQLRKKYNLSNKEWDNLFVDPMRQDNFFQAAKNLCKCLDIKCSKALSVANSYFEAIMSIIITLQEFLISREQEALKVDDIRDVNCVQVEWESYFYNLKNMQNIFKELNSDEHRK